MKGKEGGYPSLRVKDAQRKTREGLLRGKIKRGAKEKCGRFLAEFEGKKEKKNLKRGNRLKNEHRRWSKETSSRLGRQSANYRRSCRG